MTASPIEAAARALCRLDGHPENTLFEGAPMWRSYLVKERAVFECVHASPPADADPAIWRIMADTVLAAGDR